MTFIKNKSYLFVTAISAIIVFYFIWKYGLKVPFWDQWELVSYLEKLHNHNLTFSDIWQQHNEHRIFFPKLLMLILASYSGWNIFYELCTNMVLACLSLIFLFSLLNDTHRTKNTTILKIIVSLLVFSMVQCENWSWGWQIQIFMSVLGVVITIWSISKWPGKTIGLIIAMLGSILSSYSFGSGLAILPAVLFFLIFNENRKINHIIIWSIFCVVIVFLYFYRYRFSTTNAPMSYVLSNPILFVKFILTYLGASLSQKVSFSYWISIILLIFSVLAIFDIRRLSKERFKKMLPWITLIIFVIMSGIITGLGRIGLGNSQALASRYTTISYLFIVSALILLYNSIILNLEKKGKASIKDVIFISVVSLLLLAGYISTYEYGIRNMKNLGERVNQAIVCFEYPENASEDDLRMLYPNPFTVRERIKILKDIGIEYNRKDTEEDKSL